MVRSVQLAIDVLETVSFAEEEMGVTQIAARLNVTKGSVHRHLHTLVERGYLAQNPATSRYTIRPEEPPAGTAGARNRSCATGRRADARIARRARTSVVLSEMTPRGALVLATLASTSPIESACVPEANALSCDSARQGHARLRAAPFQARILSRRLEAFTDKTITSVERLEKILLDIAKRGYASAPE